MKMLNQMKLTFMSKSNNEAFSRTAVAAFMSQLDPTVDELTDLKTAVSEAVTNCIVHGYPDSIGMVYITAAIYPDSRIVVTIKDKGCGIDDIGRAMEPLYTSCPDGERAGLGFAVMQSLCDKVRVRSAPGKGTSVSLTRMVRLRGQDDGKGAE
ncbi:MAG: anti-sigma F factor [Oscillospiraceae bacterium]|jgi:stage II sporulation protein AB (anti-sigma F factor)|nr:anti-sigma F factor [Oscillospiraceae bacterium]